MVVLICSTVCCQDHSNVGRGLGRDFSQAPDLPAAFLNWVSGFLPTVLPFGQLGQNSVSWWLQTIQPPSQMCSVSSSLHVLCAGIDPKHSFSPLMLPQSASAVTFLKFSLFLSIDLVQVTAEYFQCTYNIMKVCAIRNSFFAFENVNDLSEHLTLIQKCHGCVHILGAPGTISWCAPRSHHSSATTGSSLVPHGSHSQQMCHG